MKISRKILYRHALCFLIIAACSSVTIRAHDYWFETNNFFASERMMLNLTMWVGTKLVVEEERPYQAKRTVSFELFSEGNIADLSRKTADGAIPVARFSAGKSGTYLIGMERNPVTNILDAKKFEEYLREESLDEILKERVKRGENNKFGYERYSRYIKTLIQIGDKRDDTYARGLDFKLEIIPLENPYKKRTGDYTKFKVLFNRAPLQNAAVFAYNRAGKEIFIQQMQTDKKGEIRLKLDRAGFWLVRLVKMERCRTDCEEIDWDSYWASLSFAIR